MVSFDKYPWLLETAIFLYLIILIFIVVIVFIWNMICGFHWAEHSFEEKYSKISKIIQLEYIFLNPILFWTVFLFTN